MPDENQNISIDLDVKELFRLICPACKAKVRDFTKKKIKGQIQEQMLDNMADQALERIMPVRNQRPQRVMQSVRNLPAK